MKKIWTLSASILFIFWSGLFIYNTSFIAIDGKRYFCLFDDAMISMRYGWNFAHGIGLVWDKGLRVEGVTNMLMTLYMSLAALMFNKVVAVLFVQITGVMLMLLIAYVNMNIAEEVFASSDCRNRNAFVLVSFIAVLFYYPLAYWSLMGMETSLIAVLILSATLLVIRRDQDDRPVWLLPILLGLAFITRPDSVVPATLIMASRAFSLMSINRKAIATLCKELAVVLAFVLLLSLFRLVYYGDLVPNTYFLKLTGMPIEERIVNGLGFVGPFTLSVCAPLLLSLLGTLFGRHKSKYLLASLIFSSIAYQIWVGGDPWPYWRMTAPYVPLMFILSLDALAEITVRVRLLTANKLYNHNSFGLRNVVIPLLGIALLSIANLQFLPEMFLRVKPYQTSAAIANVNTAIALNNITNQNASIAVFWAGSLPYYTDRRAIDLLGKSDKYIAHLPPDLSGDISWSGMRSVPGHNKYDLKYSILHLKPTYTQGLSWGRDNVSSHATNYKLFEYKGVNLLLDSDSSAVIWQKLDQGRSRRGMSNE